MASGFIAGVAGTGGAIRGITLASFHLSKDTFIATSAIIDLGVDLSRAVVYLAHGYFPMELLMLIPFLIGISVVGSYSGKLILDYTSELIFRYITLCVIVSVSVYQLYRLLFLE